MGVLSSVTRSSNQNPIAMLNGIFSVTSNLSAAKRKEVFNGLGVHFKTEMEKRGFREVTCHDKKGGKKWLRFRLGNISMKCEAEMNDQGKISIKILDPDNTAKGTTEAVRSVFQKLFMSDVEVPTRNPIVNVALPTPAPQPHMTEVSESTMQERRDLAMGPF